METMTKSKVSSKVIAAVATVAILAGVAGVMNEMAKARGFTFGWPIVKRSMISTQVKTATKPPKTDTKPVQPPKTTVKPPQPPKTNTKPPQPPKTNVR